ncbi:peptidoglycan-binding protein [Sorangium sp. So ce136]|uniref:peptidoglycan-binding protein n=1 Tax=Sorangium sp. So ce136 TaxID=3133284 RepID=UPI003F113F02
MPHQHIVRQGECLSSIAPKYGFADWRVIYNHPDNAEFKKRRPNPNLIYPGDVLVIPDMEPKAVEVPTGGKHVFTVKVPKTVLRLLLEVEEPFAYELKYRDVVVSGTTDGKSPIEHPIPADLDGAELAAWPDTPGNEEARAGGVTWALQLGHLDPIESASGVQGRLKNLGYFSREVDGKDGPELANALAWYQSASGLEPTGVLDDATRAKLLKRHDGA